MNTLGVFQAYLSTHQLSMYEESEISWIFSVYSFLSFFGGVQVGPIFDAKGPRLLVFLGSVLLVASTLLLSVCTSKFPASRLLQWTDVLTSYRVLAFHDRFRHSRWLGNESSIHSCRF